MDNNNDNKFRPLSSEEPEYQVYPSIERVEENLRYRQRLLGEDKKRPKKSSKIDKPVEKKAPKKVELKKENTVSVEPKPKKAKPTADIVTSDSFNFPAAKPATQEESIKKDDNSVNASPTVKPVQERPLEKPSTPRKNPLNAKEQEELRKLIADAKQEERIDSKHFGHSPTLSRKKLIDKFMVLYRRGIKLNEKQLQYVKNFFCWHPESIEPKYIRFLIPATVETMGYKSAITTVNELANVLEDTKYEAPLKDYSKFLAKKAKTVKIMELRKSGMNNEQIGEKLGLSSAEVSILSDNNEMFVFRDEDVR